MNLGKIFKYLLWGSITLLFVGGFLWNCTFGMDSVKYPTRMNCGVSQYMNAVNYVVTKYTEYLKEKMERRVERKLEAMSGMLNNFETSTTKKEIP